MKKLVGEIRFIFLAITSFVGSCYILGMTVNWAVEFLESKEMLGDILSMIAFAIVFTILLSGTLIISGKE